MTPKPDKANGLLDRMRYLVGHKKRHKEQAVDGISSNSRFKVSKTSIAQEPATLVSQSHVEPEVAVATACTATDLDLSINWIGDN
jgi:hypothetical protein